MLTRTQRYLFSILSGVLMVVAFPYTGSLFPLAFFAWIPLLLVEHNVYKNKYRPGKVLLHAYITFVIYNAGATYWVFYSEGGEFAAILAYLLNGFLMAAVFWFFHLTKRYVGQKEGYIGLVFYWVGFEYIHYVWELSWTWLTIGNVFSRVPEIVQWYSFSGALGGSLWILLVNLIGFKLADNVFNKKEGWRIQTPIIYGGLFVLLLPIIISLTTYYTYKEKQDPLEVVITQPNIDPYNEKFTGNLEDQLNNFLAIADDLITPQTQVVLAPETAISTSFFEENFEGSRIHQLLMNRIIEWNGPSLFLGASTYRSFDEPMSRAARPYSDGNGFYESYNSSLLLDRNIAPQFVHKSKLVLGVEKLPFSNIFPFLEKLAIDNGGTTGTLGVESEPKILYTKGFAFAPIVCYESVYGGFIAEQCRKGAQAIFVITNDGWWGNSAGHKQHQSFSRLRAIENRRYVARSANTGISSIINQRGDVLQQTPYWVRTGIRGTIQLNHEPTFYTTYGDVIGRTFSFVFVLLLVYTATKYLRRLRG
jgi:apolipoprotein N-acyltransferase